MTVAIRLFYYKAVNPSCDVVEMDTITWNEFRFANREERLAMALKLTNKKSMDGYVRELTWIPLDGQDLVIVNPKYL